MLSSPSTQARASANTENIFTADLSPNVRAVSMKTSAPTQCLEVGDHPHGQGAPCRRDGGPSLPAKPPDQAAEPGQLH